MLRAAVRRVRGCVLPVCREGLSGGVAKRPAGQGWDRVATAATKNRTSQGDIPAQKKPGRCGVG